MAESRTALAAVVVTAVLGLASIVAGLVTVIVTNRHDNQRLRSQLAQSDRVELRSVLDRAAAALYATKTRFQEVTLDGRGDHNAGEFKLLQRDLDALDDRYIRVEIRLGRRAHASTRMSEARAAAHAAFDKLLALDDALRSTGSVGARAERRAKDWVAALQRYSDQTDRFIDAAHGVARSLTD